LTRSFCEPVPIVTPTTGSGPLAAPAVPASTTPLTNTLGVAALVTVRGGTVSAIAVDGVTVGTTDGAVVVPAGSTITLTYSVAPTWTWFGIA
jgi:hypothetical protein